MGIIISGFSNIGKTTLTNKNEYNAIDLDTHYFNKTDNWIDIYIECVMALKDKYDYVLITTHGEVLHELNKRSIDYYLVYPKLELKEEYKNRAITRGSNNEFIEGFFNMWNEHIKDCEKNKFANKIILESNQFLIDVIKDIK